MAVEESASFGALLRWHRVRAGLTQQTLAERAGMSLRGLSDLERGARQAPYPGTVRRLAEALGLLEEERTALLGASRRRRSTQVGMRPTASDRPSHNLPRQLTSFIGRDRDLLELQRLVVTSPLLTLTGAGGIGKTRLALCVAEAVLSSYPDGAWLVELAALTDSQFLAHSVAVTLGVSEQPRHPLTQRVAEHIGSRRQLLVLDNCEHLVDACAELADGLLRACPHLRILATSREPLRVPGETIWRVEPLESPKASASVGQIRDAAAVRLFVERTRAVEPAFVLTDRTLGPVAALCRGVDGLPLALELAAARVPGLGVETLARRLDNRLRLLAAGSRTAPARQQTLRATMDWSYDLLTEVERRVFDRLAVFATGWSLEAAEAVGAGDGVDPGAVVDLLGRLVDKSLVVVEEGLEGEQRYRLLETLRQYGWERLATSGASEAAQRRHVAFFLALAERAEPELMGAEQGVWLWRLEQEHDNLRAALQWTIERREGELGLRLAGALARFWGVRGYLSEGRRWLEGLLTVAQTGVPALAATCAKALGGAGALASDQGDYSRAAVLIEESLVLRRDLGDKGGIAWSLNNMARVASDQGDNGRAAVLLEESLALRRDLGDTGGIALALHNLGLTATYQGEYSRAAALLEESLALRRDLGDKGGIALGLHNLGLTATYQGDYSRAAALLVESLALRRDLGDKGGIAWSLNSLARVARDQGEYSRAAALLEESLTLLRDLGDKRGIALALHNLGVTATYHGDYHRAAVLLEESLALFRDLADKRGSALGIEEFGALACAQTHPERAARLFGAAQALREAIGAPLPPAEQGPYDRNVAAARALLGEHAFAVAWAEGRALSVDQAIAAALTPPEREVEVLCPVAAVVVTSR